MVLWLKIPLVLVALGILALILAAWIGTVIWDKSTSRLVETLSASQENHSQDRVNFKELNSLPEPVARYFRLVLKEGQPIIRSVKLSQKGEFRTRPTDKKWANMEAVQHFTARGRGFVWDASIRMMPLLTVRVRDTYVKGQGFMTAKLMSLITVVDEHDKSELNGAALQRYLAEAVWFPTALLPSQGVEWSEINNHTARATLRDYNTSVSLEFHFNQVGEIVGIYTPGRYREVNGKYELTPWSGQYRRYEERNGIRIPLEGEVKWELSSGSFPYWKGELVEIEYVF
ncbi:hypothetical protein KFV02_06410 [Desulfohalobiaceae bacterium Ax17]|uniref:DUF6920 family protein n=1 Tax=Desulfovulcanus ferrireducens TaxID=2831190 RepID=UPI00207BCE10|nr:DUF6544 family protein [Desulfovulcanus ferrireducens]MBT8763563.1 hypothetical protein [Desulfovulcanus ferrireducens]